MRDTHDRAVVVYLLIDNSISYSIACNIAHRYPILYFIIDDYVLVALHAIVVLCLEVAVDVVEAELLMDVPQWDYLIWTLF